MDKKTIAVVGTGRWGTKIINTLKSLEVDVICCNTSGKFGDKWCYNDYHKMFNEKPDGVVIAANPAMNFQMMQHAELLKIPVMVEKPVAFDLIEIKKMEALRIPILVDYIYLFNNRYKAFKNSIHSPIKRIVSVGVNNGPFRHFSGLFDYGPHDLSLAMDLLPSENFEVLQVKAIGNTKTSGNIYNLHLKAGNADIIIKTGNGSEARVRELSVFCEDGSEHHFEDDGTSKQPLETAMKEFIKVIDGAKPIIPFDLTLKVHKALFDMGNNWKKEKR